MPAWLLAIGIGLLLWPASAEAGIFNEARARKYEFYPRLRKTASIRPATPHEQFCVGFVYWQGEGGLSRNPRRSAACGAAGGSWGGAAAAGAMAAARSIPVSRTAMAGPCRSVPARRRPGRAGRPPRPSALRARLGRLTTGSPVCHIPA